MRLGSFLSATVLLCCVASARAAAPVPVVAAENFYGDVARQIGGTHVNVTSILANPDLAWIAIVIVTAWQAIPSALIIYLAGLLAIPEEVYEASSLDGATPWRQFTAITLPLVAGYVVINTVLGFKNFLNAYDIIVGLTNGGPGTATSSVAMTIFTGFTSGDYAYQMANAVVFFIITVVISVLQLRIINRRGVSL